MVFVPANSLSALERQLCIARHSVSVVKASGHLMITFSGRSVHIVLVDGLMVLFCRTCVQTANICLLLSLLLSNGQLKRFHKYECWF